MSETSDDSSLNSVDLDPMGKCVVFVCVFVLVTPLPVAVPLTRLLTIFLPFSPTLVWYFAFFGSIYDLKFFSQR